MACPHVQFTGPRFTDIFFYYFLYKSLYLRRTLREVLRAAPQDYQPAAEVYGASILNFLSIGCLIGCLTIHRRSVYRQKKGGCGGEILVVSFTPAARGFPKVHRVLRKTSIR